MGDMPTQPVCRPFRCRQNESNACGITYSWWNTNYATDMLESMGHKLVEGNNVTISLNPDTKEEADRLYSELSQGGTDGVAPHDEFWATGNLQRQIWNSLDVQYYKTTQLIKKTFQ
jgi:PhnB protein